MVSENKQEPAKVKKLRMDELSIFSYQLSLILKSGVPYLDGIELLKDEIASGQMKQLVKRLYEDLKSGMKLYESFEKQGVFPGYFVHMTKIAEKAGMLDVEMEQLSQFYDRTEKLQYKLRNALIYPVVLFVLMASVLMLLVLKVFPVFQEVLASLGGELPSSTSVIFELSSFLQRSTVWILAVVFAIILGVYAFTRTEAGGIWSDELKLKSRFVRRMYQKAIALRFAQGMAMMVRAGIPFEDAIQMSAPLTGNEYARKRINEAEEEVAKGVPVVEALKSTDIFPELFIQMMRVGFRSGQVDTMLSKLTEIYDMELDRATQRVASALEPALVIALSLVVAIVLLTVMLPMIQIMTSIG